MIEINNIAQNCEQLKLTGILQSYQSIATECCKTQASYTEYLSLWHCCKPVIKFSKISKYSNKFIKHH